VRGIDKAIDADVLVSHLDLSVTPEAYLRFFAAHERVVNGRVRDITKRAFSDDIVGPHDEDAGRVIVKTNLNMAGLPDLRMKQGRRAVARAWVARTLRSIPFAASLRHRTATHPYRIYETVADVPDDVWTRTDLVVQRFTPDIDDGLYCLRTYMFFGDRGRTMLVKSPSPIVKAGNVVHRERVETLPELVEIRDRLEFDYGKFDHVVHEGRVRLLDTNRCPTIGRHNKGESLAEGVALRAGIDRWLASA
jgi:hypothetical protein